MNKAQILVISAMTELPYTQNDSNMMRGVVTAKVVKWLTNERVSNIFYIYPTGVCGMC